MKNSEYAVKPLESIVLKQVEIGTLSSQGQGLLHIGEKFPYPVHILEINRGSVGERGCHSANINSPLHPGYNLTFC